MKKLWFVASISLSLLTGCWDRTEVNDLAIVTMAAIDKGKNDNVLLSVQIFVPRALGGGGTGSGGDGSGGKLTMVQSSEGVNMADAMSKLQTKISRQIFWGHCKVYMFGEAVARKGVADHIDYLVRHPEPRNRANLFVSRGDAVDMLKLTPVLERSTAETLREIADLHIGMSVTLVDFRNMLRGEGEAVVLPVIENGKRLGGKEGKEVQNVLAGTAVFKRDKMVGLIPPTPTRGLLWLRDEISRAAITVRIKNTEGVVSVTPIRMKARLTPRIENGKWSMLVKVDTEGNVVENGTRLNLLKPEWLAQVQQAVGEDIDHRIKMALHILQDELKADVVNFAAAFHRNYPQEWEDAQKRWDEIFPKIEVNTHINVDIRRPGLISIPAGIPQSEVKDH
ncbi:Ger(x)C family spore germination protein [Brevibacillus brevis]|uniref:Ger(X)C family spore germination protein n=1 Tax=Brevibacillus brevis TaxID=1393 RepID=A0ABY9SWJ5_BREBE|nr:Ger(x)C family spore germination protein [Brevibacillus brevis]WNC12195.1 Ger(x)C family spore germination protein [Brevibacillus brevis]